MYKSLQSDFISPFTTSQTKQIKTKLLQIKQDINNLRIQPVIQNLFLPLQTMKPSIFYLTIIILTLCIFINSAVVINKLDNITNSSLVYSGFMPVSDTSADQLFFTFYSAKDAKTDTDIPKFPLIVVVGSPGSSAQYYNLAGMGPLTLNPDMTTAPNPSSVTSFANVMFVDLLGNGFSFLANTSDFPTKAEDYASQLTYALNALTKDSQLGRSNVIVIVGEGTFLRSLPGLGDISALAGFVHLSAWPQLYAVSKYYGVAGIELKIFNNSEKVAIESTLVTCYNNVVAKKYTQAHNCYDTILNFVESKTKNVNIFNTQMGSNLTEHLPMIQYYFSLSSVVSAFKAPTVKLFESQSSWTWSKGFTDFAVNKTSDLSQFMRDYLSVKHFYISGDYDYIAFKQSLRFWIENQLNFLERAAFKSAKLQDVVVDGKTVGYGKQVKQVRYTELLQSGHYIAHDQPEVLAALLKDWIAGLSAQQKPTNKESFNLLQQ